MPLASHELPEGGQPMGFEPTHVPAVQAKVWSHLLADVLRLHATPQRPQFALSPCGSTQTLPHRSEKRGSLHMATQLPVLLHPRRPFPGLAGHDTQALLQTISPARQAPH